MEESKYSSFREVLATGLAVDFDNYYAPIWAIILNIEARKAQLFNKGCHFHALAVVNAKYEFRGLKTFSQVMQVLAQLYQTGQMHSGTRIQFLIYNEDPVRGIAHWFCLDMGFFEHGVSAFLIDAANNPYHPFPMYRSKVIKSIKTHFSRADIYVSVAGLQKDFNSCRIYTLDHAISLAKIGDLHESLRKRHDNMGLFLDDSNHCCYVVAVEMLPPTLLVTSQSKTVINGFMDNHKEASTIPINKKGRSLSDIHSDRKQRDTLIDDKREKYKGKSIKFCEEMQLEDPSGITERHYQHFFEGLHALDHESSYHRYQFDAVMPSKQSDVLTEENSILFRWIEKNNLADLQQFAQFLDFEAQNVDRLGQSAIHYAVQLGFLDICKFLCARYSFLINARDLQGNTPLHAAVQYNKPDAINCLLSFVADVNAENYDHLTPVQLAVFLNFDGLLLWFKRDAYKHTWLDDIFMILRYIGRQSDTTLAQKKSRAVVCALKIIPRLSIDELFDFGNAMVVLRTDQSDTQLQYICEEVDVSRRMTYAVFSSEDKWKTTTWRTICEAIKQEIIKRLDRGSAEKENKIILDRKTYERAEEIISVKLERKQFPVPFFSEKQEDSNYDRFQARFTFPDKADFVETFVGSAH